VNMVFSATLKIGMQDEPKQLNPFKASDVWSWNVLGFFYEGLYTHNPQTFEIIPWLAEGEPVYNHKNNTCVVHLKKGVKWEDGQPFTAEDVAFSANVLMEFKIPRYYSDWDFITKVEAVDNYTVKFWLKEPYAIFFTRTLMSLIVPKHIWQPIIEEIKKTKDPLTSLMEYEVTKPIGMGTFKFVDWKKGSYVQLVKNPLYFATGRTVKGKKVGPYFDEILFKIYGTTDAAILALKKGDIDFIWWPIQPGFVSDLQKDKKITLTNNPENGLKYLAFNLRRPPFNDINFRQAVAYLIDKKFIQSRILQNYGLPNDTIMPPGNKFWYNPNTLKYGANLNQPMRIKKAIAILKKAGYSWKKEPKVNANGQITKGEGLKMPDGTPVKPFKILTPPADYDPLRAMCGTLIQEWLRQIAIPAIATPTSFGDIINKVMTEWDFDVFILGYRLSLDPDFMRSFFHSKEVVKDGNNPMGYINPEFDRLADASAKEMVREKRREYILELQDFIIREVPWVPLYTLMQIEAYRNDRFRGWVNQLDGIGNGWSFVFIKPM
ncbi:MAG: ABC transporter substrate-binding protein, partial [bacterium]